MYKCGLVSVSFRNNTVEEIVKAVKYAGLSCIEWGSDVHAKNTDTERLTQIADLCKKENIEICSYGTYFKLGETPISQLLSYINAAKTLNTDILRLWCGVKGYKEYTDTEFSALVSECKASAKIAEENGVTLCMECHNNTVTDCIDGALRMMKEVDSDNFKMYWQPNQYKSLRENIEYARKIAEYTTHIHVFNWEGNNKYPLCDGIKIWQKYLAEFDENHALLLEFMPDNDINSLNTEAKVLFEIIKG